jgi:hypothetical protein
MSTSVTRNNDDQGPRAPTGGRRRALLGGAAALAVPLIAAGVMLMTAGATARPSDPNLRVALSYVGRQVGDRYTLSFINWRAIEKSIGIPLGPGASQARESAFYEKLSRLAAVPSIADDLPAGGLFSHSDLAWEESLQPSGGPVLTIVGFAPGFDLAAARRRLERCKYRPTVSSGVTAYWEDVGGAPICGSSLPPVTYIAIDTQRPVMLMSNSDQAIVGAIRSERRGAGSQPTPLLAAVGSNQVVAAIAAPRFCSTLSRPRLIPSGGSQASQFDVPGSPYQSLAYGYRFSANNVTGQIVMQYASAQAAERDLRRREHALASEASLDTNQPYSDLVKLDGGRVQGPDLVLQVSRPGGGRLELSTMWQRLDLVFADC